MSPLLAQLRSERAKYRNVLKSIMDEKVEGAVGVQELQMWTSVSSLQETTYIAEQASGKCCVLALRPIDVHNVEEAILRVQGFILDTCLPPVRQFNIPRNLNRLIDLKQSITLTGLGTEGFDAAIHGVQTIYQFFNNHVTRAGGRLKEWSPGCDGQDLTLTFANRYLTSARDVGGELPVDLATTVDPFNVLRPLIKTEVHTADNVVEYWEHHGREAESPKGSSKGYTEIKPALLTLTHLVEVQVSFVIVRIARQEYVLIPKLRAICLLDRTVETDYNLSAIRTLASSQLSPLKKVKRKVGYRLSSSDESGNDDVQPPPSKQLRGLTLAEVEETAERTDVPMKESS